MSQPTREEVAESYKRVTDALCTVYAQANLDVLWQAYLAQMEDMEKISPYVVGLVMEIADLRAGNRALREQLAKAVTYGEPRKGEPLRYITDDATGDDGNEGGQP